jgi:hypothetical protein
MVANIKSNEGTSLEEYNCKNISKNELTEIYRYILSHNKDVLIKQKKEKKEKEIPTIITFNGFKQNNKNEQMEIKTNKNFEFYINIFKNSLSIEDIELWIKKIEETKHANQIKQSLLLYLNNEKTSIIKLKYQQIDPEDRKYLNAEIEQIDLKISSLLSSIYFNEEVIDEQIKYNDIYLLRLPSGNIALKEDLEHCISKFSGDPNYITDIIELFESIKTDLRGIKKLSFGCYELKNYQFRLAFSIVNNKLVIINLFVKKSTKDQGTYDTLRNRLKLLNSSKEDVIDNNDIELLDKMIDELKTYIDRR